MAEFMSNLTSPAKLAFAAYILLVYHGDVHPQWWITLAVFVAFILLQIFHDDYWRLLLNNRAGRINDQKKAVGLSKT
jgi:hypothetical protein